VIFVDFDQYLLAPRETARREALLAVAKAGRLVGPRSSNSGLVIVQTRRGEDLVLGALTSGDVTTVMNEEVDIAKLLELPPYVAMAEISGDAASTFVGELGASVRVSRVGDAYVVRAPDTATLTSALNATARPSGKLRIAVH
jgi:primosomal protein N'